jgi:hypothetical protein
MALFSQYLSQVGLWPDSQDSFDEVQERAASIEYKPDTLWSNPSLE